MNFLHARQGQRQRMFFWKIGRLVFWARRQSANGIIVTGIELRQSHKAGAPSFREWTIELSSRHIKEGDEIEEVSPKQRFDTHK